MKVLKLKKIANALKVDENFATLMQFSARSGVSTYEFAYLIDTVQAVNKGFTDVRIQIRSDPPKKPASIFAASNVNLGVVQKPKPDQIVNNVQLAVAAEKDVKNVNVAVVVKSIKTDLTAKISNELATTKPGVMVSPLEVKPKKKFVAKTVQGIQAISAGTEPILQISGLQALPKKKTFPALSVTSVFQEKKDPSEVLVSAKFVTPTAKALAGTIVAVPVKPKLPAMNVMLANVVKAAPISTSNDLIGEAVVPVLETIQDPVARVTKLVKLKQSDIQKVDTFSVTFELRDAGGIVVEKIERKVPHGKNIKVIQTPVTPPKVSVAKVNIVGKNILEIEQTDKNATAIRLFRKTVSPTVRLEDLEYEFVEEFDLTVQDGKQQVVDFTNNVNNVIYRVFSIGPQDQPSSEFTNVVSPGVRIGGLKKAERPVHAGVVARVVQEGIRIQIVSISPGPIAVKILRRDRTKFQNKDSDFVAIPHETTKKEVVLIAGENVPGSFLDTDLVESHLYEYCCQLIYDNGDQVIATGCDFIEFIPLSEGVAVTRTTAARPVNREGGLDVTFRINTKLLDTDLDIVKSLLEKQGQDTLWTDELKNEKDSLQKLIAHKIRRVDLTTGESAHFQTFTGDFFSDLTNRAQASVPPLKTGHRYRYYISALLRAPETLFENNTKTITNKVGVAVNILPLKFKHPITLKKGNLVSVASLKAQHPEDPFEFGNIGNVKEVNVTMEGLQPRLTRGRAIRFNNNTNIVRWEILGDKTQIDHFIILMDRMGQEEVVGKAHPIFDADFIEFIDKLDKDETGEMRYRIIPVMNNYEHGPPLTTNGVIV